MVQFEHADRNPAVTDNRKITFSVPKGLKRLGVDNGSRTRTQKFQADSLVSESGRALLNVQSGETPGRYDIGIEAEGLPGTTVQIEVRSGAYE